MATRDFDLHADAPEGLLDGLGNVLPWVRGLAESSTDDLGPGVRKTGSRNAESEDVLGIKEAGSVDFVE